MSSILMSELEHNRKRLEYYSQLKEKSAGEPSPAVKKWIEIYSERVKKHERKLSRLGLKTQVPASPEVALAPSARRA